MEMLHAAMQIFACVLAFFAVFCIVVIAFYIADEMIFCGELSKIIRKKNKHKILITIGTLPALSACSSFTKK